MTLRMKLGDLTMPEVAAGRSAATKLSLLGVLGAEARPCLDVLAPAAVESRLLGVSGTGGGGMAALAGDEAITVTPLTTRLLAAEARLMEGVGNPRAGWVGFRGVSGTNVMSRSLKDSFGDLGADF